MSFQTTATLPRGDLSDEALEAFADELSKAGRMPIRGPDGDMHYVRIFNVKATLLGVKYTLDVDLDGPGKKLRDQITQGRHLAVSMGCKVEEPPPCSICEAD